MDSTAQEIAMVLLDSGAVSLRPHRPFRLTSGLLAPIYCDNRLLLGQVSARATISTAMAQLIAAELTGIEMVAGMATAGIAWAAWVADRLSLPMGYVRSVARTHGRAQQIEGGIQPHQRVVLVEDLASTGGSALKGVTALRSSEALVSDCCVIFTYGLPVAQASFAAAGVRLLSLTDFPTLIQTALSANYITAENHAILLDWAADPAGWPERSGIAL